jgi:hypothetical protein
MTLRGAWCTVLLMALVAVTLPIVAAWPQNAKPDLSITSVFPGPANTNRFCIGRANSVYVTVNRQGGEAFTGPIAVWLTGQSLTGTLPAGSMQRIEYVRGASSWLVIFRDVVVSADWRTREPAFTVIVNPETEGRREILESNYNNNSYRLSLLEHTDWSRKCS